MAMKSFRQTSFLLFFSSFLSLFFVSNIWADTEPNNECAQAELIELNSTNLCTSIDGNVSTLTNDVDIYKIYLPNPTADNNLSYTLTSNDGTKKLEYSYLTTCSESPTTTTVGGGASVNGSENSIPQGSYRYIYIAGGSNNALSPYTLQVGLPGCSV